MGLNKALIKDTLNLIIYKIINYKFTYFNSVYLLTNAAPEQLITSI